MQGVFKGRGCRGRCIVGSAGVCSSGLKGTVYCG